MGMDGMMGMGMPLLSPEMLGMAMGMGMPGMMGENDVALPNVLDVSFNNNHDFTSGPPMMGMPPMPGMMPMAGVPQAAGQQQGMIRPPNVPFGRLISCLGVKPSPPFYILKYSLALIT